MNALLRLCAIWLVAVIAIFGGARCAQAQTSVWVHGVSFHPEGADWNEKNWGLGVRYQFSSDWSVQGGFYKNSYSRRSDYLLAQWQPVTVYGVRLGAFAGYLSGYRLAYPLGAGFMASVPLSAHLTLGLRHIPKVGKLTTSVTALELGWSF